MTIRRTTKTFVISTFHCLEDFDEAVKREDVSEDARGEVVDYFAHEYPRTQAGILVIHPRAGIVREAQLDGAEAQSRKIATWLEDGAINIEYCLYKSRTREPLAPLDWIAKRIREGDLKV